MSGGMICVCMKSIMDLYIFFYTLICNFWNILFYRKKKKKSDKAIKRPRDLIAVLKGHRTLTGQYVNLVQW